MWSIKVYMTIIEARIVVAIVDDVVVVVDVIIAIVLVVFVLALFVVADPIKVTSWGQ